MNRVMVFDTETTSLVANHSMSLALQPHIIEFYGAIVNPAGEVIEELDFLSAPPVPITEEITKITGITEEMVKGQPSFAARLDEVERMIASADAVVAHNLSFDMFVLESEFARAKHKPVWPEIRICTVEQTQHILGHRMRLSQLHEHLFGEKFDGAHRAKVDVTALIRCFNRLREEDLV
jgi:DNA polymerase-3 subunit epsilon